jgi:hypothetical protein
VIETIEKFDDSLAKLIDSTDKSDDNVAELEQTTTDMVAMMKDEAQIGDDGNWMDEEYKSASDALMENNCFHMDVQEQGHHERNGEVEKNEQLMQKQWVALNKKMGGRNGCQNSSYSKLFQNDFEICDVCCNMSEENAVEKLQRLAKEVEP